VGRHLAATLGREHSLHCLIRRPLGMPGEIVHDLGEPLPRARLPARIDAVLHSGALVGAVSGEIVRRVNVDSTRALAEYAREAGASTFVFCSTGGVYACSEAVLAEDSPTAPTGDYAQSKLEAEQLLAGFASDLHVQVLRLFFPYGPGQEGRLLSNLMQRIRAGLPVRLGQGAQRPVLSPIFIDDLVEQLSRTIALPMSFTANVSGTQAVSLQDIALRLGELLERKVSFEFGEDAPRCNWIGSGERMAALCGYVPRVGLDEGLAHTARAFLERPLAAGAA